MFKLWGLYTLVCGMRRRCMVLFIRLFLAVCERFPGFTRGGVCVW